MTKKNGYDNFSDIHVGMTYMVMFQMMMTKLKIVTQCIQK